jgi:hypothetical protein
MGDKNPTITTATTPLMTSLFGNAQPPRLPPAAPQTSYG